MKVERKLSNFSAKKGKRNKNMKTKTKICGTKMKTEIFWRKWKRKRNDVFLAEQMLKRKFPFPTNMEFHFIVVLHSQSSRSNVWSCHIELSKQPTPTLQLHWVILTGLENKFFVYLTCLSFTAWFRWSFGSDNHPIFVRVRTVFVPFLFSEVSVFIFIFSVSVFVSASA
jgi:hypothetical protein